MRTRGLFTREFKRETACMVLDQGFSSREVCEQSILSSRHMADVAGR